VGTLVELSIADVGLVAWYAAVVLLPGGVVGYAGGLRGWQLVVSAPLLSYAVAGLTGPLTSAVGIGWSPAVLLAGTLLLAGAVTVLRAWIGSRGYRPEVRRPAPWTRAANGALASVVALAAVVGAGAVLGGVRRLGAIPQDWDAVFHANGIRWIDETGDAGLFGMSRVNWYEPGTSIFYPNAYHLLGAVVRVSTGGDVPSVLNAHTMLIPGLAALVLAGLVRRFGGSVVAASGAALAAVAVGPLYDMLWRGPLLPYATAVALAPAFVVLLADLLDARGTRARAGRGALLALSTAGLVCLHPATLFGAAVLGTGYLLGRWTVRRTGIGREALVATAAGAAGLLLAFQQIDGAIYSAANYPPADWPADLTWPHATSELVTFSHAALTPQTWLTVLAAVGLLTYGRLDELRWVGVPLAVFGVLFVLSASSDAGWVNTLTRPWWNDRFRLAGIFGLLACVLVGHGLAQVHRAVTVLPARMRTDLTVPARERPVAAGVAVLLAFVLVSGLLYLPHNAPRMGRNVGDGPAVSAGEIAAMQALGELVPPGVRVLNDRNDGSVWMYAIAGVLPVAGHYDATNLGETDVGLLESRFDEYEHDPAVRAAAERLNVGYVMVGRGFLRGDSGRAAGLTDLDGAPYLEQVFRNDDATIYRIVGTDPGRP
jgi:hypothetical protein